MDIYFSHYITDLNDDYKLDTGQDLLHYDIENLYDNLKKNNFLTNYLKCPAAINELQKIYIVKSHLDSVLHLDKKKNEISIKGNSSWMVERTFFPIDDFFKSFSLNSNLILFSEADVNVTQIPPYMHNVIWKNQNVFCSTGYFNISKWFRPLNPTWTHNNETLDFKISRGDPLYYLRFETDKKINLIRYNMNENLLRYSRQCIDAKNWYKNRPLKFWYDKFVRNNYNSKILNEIKQNLF